VNAAVVMTGVGVVEPGSSWSAEADLAENNWRQLDRTGHLATLAGKRALEAAGRSISTSNAAPIGLCLGTMFGGLKTICDFDRRAITAGPQYAKPMDFANSVINAAAGQVAIWHHLEGVNATISGGPSAGLQAVAWAAELIRRGRAGALLAGGADEACDDARLAFGRRGDLATGPARPFDAERAGFALAEGSALVMLEAAEAARSRGARIHGEILGWASTFDPGRGHDPARGARAAERALLGALADAGIAASDIAVVAAGANGSRRGDEIEARAIAAVFGPTVPVLVTKGGLGETLGAAGGFALAALVEALTRGEIPPAGGLENYDDALPEIGVAKVRQSLGGRVGVVHAAGFDGQHVALVVAGAPATENLGGKTA
jgi:3-oxoacyl-(acyl-carrier-protein) synthase